ncbi:hypothetical protein AB833_12320 [Chromatiales bacterium (ex Bugula neritina AB1)]|nr:hypothetical protein AB833_12320 [Chromatiales bacterium (ex Bugula neritina AB1)]
MGGDEVDPGKYGNDIVGTREEVSSGDYSAISTAVGKSIKLMGLDGNILAEYELLRAEIAEK